MPEITTDWEAAAKAEEIVEGRYPARIDKVELKKTQKGDDMLNVTITITQEPMDGRKVWDTFLLTPNFLWKLRGLLTAIGMGLDDSLDTDNLEEQEVGIVVIGEMYEGRPMARVKGYWNLNDPQPE